MVQCEETLFHTINWRKVERLLITLITSKNTSPQPELNILILAFLIILIVLFLHLVFRWFRIYRKKLPSNGKIKEPEITLKKIPTPKFKLMVGSSYLVLERTEADVGQGFKIFKDILRTGSPGLVITRIYPEKIVKKFNLGGIPVIWLSRSKNKHSVSPTNLGAIVEEIKEFMSKQKESIIMFDGLEYLAIHNEFDRVLKFLHSLQDEVAVHNSRMITSLNPSTLGKKDIALLSKEMKVLNIDQKKAEQKNHKMK